MATLAGLERDVQAALDKGAHTVRVNVNLLQMLLGAHQLLSAAMAEVERKVADEQH